MDRHEEVPKHQSSRNTRKWCKGKHGKKHEPRWVVDAKFDRQGLPPVLAFECHGCRKIFDRWFTAMLDGPRPELGSTTPRNKKK